MAKLERPKGYSRELWKKLQRQIKNIERFIKEKTETGVKIKEAPDVEDVYTAKGRKKIREWSTKKQWESSEYVDRETNEVLTGKEAKRAWSKQTREERRRDKQPEPEQVPTFDIYEAILEELRAIPNEKVVYSSSARKLIHMETGGMRDRLISMLNDIAFDTDYLEKNQSAISENIYAIQFASKQNDINYAYGALLSIFNGGALSLQQWDDLQGTALNYQ